jgi:uncharacterized protein (DUF58 family)
MPLEIGAQLRAWLDRRAADDRASETRERVAVSRDSLIALRALTARLTLAQRRPSGSALAGGRRAAPRGRGLDFEELRAYQPGDDIRSIHWGATARSGRAHTKLYREERARTLWLLVDLRAGMHFATRGAFKSVLAAKAATTLAWAAHEEGERIGAVILAENGLHLLRPAGGRLAMRRLVRSLTEAHAAERAHPEAQVPSLAQAAALLCRLAERGGLALILSDFRDLRSETARHLAALARRTDLFGCFIFDPAEAGLPEADELWVSDGEDLYRFEASDPEYCAAYRAAFERHSARVAELFTSQRTHLLRLATHNDLQESLALVLRARARGAFG